MEGWCDVKLTEVLSERLKKMATVDVDATYNKIQAVLSNNLVGERILSHLSFDDMKAASEVSREFHKMVRGSTQFNEKAVLEVTEDTMELAHLLLNTEHDWRGIRIGVMMSMEALHFLSHMLESVQFVSLVWVRETTAKESEGAEAKFISGVLSSTPKLTHLEIDFHLLQEIFFRDVFSLEDVRANMKNLTRLEFLDANDEFSLFNRFVNYSSNSNDHDLDSEQFKRLKSNFQQFAELPMRLQLFRMSKAKLNFLDPTQTGLMNSIPTIMNNNKKTLEELSIHLRAWKVEDLRSVILPGLKRLTVKINPEDQQILGEFLTNHPLLEELEIGVKDQFSRNLLHVIQNSCGKLTKLHLKTKTFSGFGAGETVDWSFLGKIEFLKDFRISRPSYTATNADVFGTGTQFLMSLPKNQLQSLSFKGIFGVFRQFWMRTGGVGILQPDLVFKTDILWGFRNLKRLSFVRCDEAVNDKLMQFILKEFLSLEELKISHCHFLSDAGITGTGTCEEGGVSLRNLQRLTLLSIRACAAVTPAGLLSSLALPSLTAFEYLTPLVPVFLSFVQQLVRQNPILTEIGVQLLAEEEEGNLEMNLKETCGRLVKVVHLEESWIDNDSDSEAEDLEDPDVNTDESSWESENDGSEEFNMNHNVWVVNRFHYENDDESADEPEEDPQDESDEKAEGEKDESDTLRD